MPNHLAVVEGPSSNLQILAVKASESRPPVDSCQQTCASRSSAHASDLHLSNCSPSHPPSSPWFANTAGAHALDDSWSATVPPRIRSIIRCAWLRRRFIRRFLLRKRLGFLSASPQPRFQVLSELLNLALKCPVNSAAPGLYPSPTFRLHTEHLFRVLCTSKRAAPRLSIGLLLSPRCHRDPCR